MVQFVIASDHGAVLCRLALEPSTTVGEMLAQVEQVHPGVRVSTTTIRNDAYGTVLDLNNGAGEQFCYTLLQANLTVVDAPPLETLILTHRNVFGHFAPESNAQRGEHVSASPDPAAVSAKTRTTHSHIPKYGRPPKEVIAANILRLFAGGTVTASTTAETSPEVAPAQAEQTQTQQNEEKQQPNAPSATALPSVTSTVPPAVEAHPVAHATTAATTGNATLDAEFLSPEMLDMQRRLYERIQQQRIDENYFNALEYTPEVFASVAMLYVPCTINQVPIKALVDSGAQMTIMNSKAAEKCWLMSLVDKRRQGIAIGVGQQHIIGRVHMAPVNIAGMYLPFAFDVLDEMDIDVIIGLDQLRRHQMIIDLKNNQLTIGDKHVGFLPESELPPRGRPFLVDNEKGGDITAGNNNTTRNSIASEEDAEMRSMPQVQRSPSQPQSLLATNKNNNSDSTLPASRPSSDRIPIGVPPSFLPQPASSTTAFPRTNGVGTGVEPAQVLTPTAYTTTTNASPVAAVDNSAVTFTESEINTRIDNFMEFTGIEDRAEGKRLLEAAGWDPDVAASRYFSVE